MNLTETSCTPCQGGSLPLDYQAASALLEHIPEWSLTHEASRLERRFAFKDFAAALDFINRVGDLAEQEGHHPELHFGWGYAIVEFYTHKINGLHENDFIMASKVNQLYR